MRQSEISLSLPKQELTLIFDIWVFNSELFTNHSSLSCTPILLFIDKLVLPEVSLTLHIYARKGNRNPALITAVWISDNT